MGSATTICSDKTGTLTLNQVGDNAVALETSKRNIPFLPVHSEFHFLVNAFFNFEVHFKKKLLPCLIIDFFVSFNNIRGVVFERLKLDIRYF